MTRVAITGATGLIGGALTRSLRASGHSVVSIGRGANSDFRWDPRAGTIERGALDGADAVVHLAGAPIAQRWTRSRKRAILSTRVQSTELIARTIADASPHPPVLVCASAIGFYGNRADELLTEASERGAGFLADVVDAWERSADVARHAGVRVAHVRTGIVLSRDGGALAKMLPAFRLGVGGPLGTGEQWMSWIGLSDVVRAMRHVIDDDLRGPVNVVAPAPVRNAEFARVLGGVLHRPAMFRVPAFVLSALFGEMARETVLAGQRVVPRALQDSGFAFEEPTLEGALRRAIRRGAQPTN